MKKEVATLLLQTVAGSSKPVYIEMMLNILPGSYLVPFVYY
jgi:hypothetical protein